MLINISVLPFSKVQFSGFAKCKSARNVQKTKLQLDLVHPIAVSAETTSRTSYIGSIADVDRVSTVSCINLEKNLVCMSKSVDMKCPINHLYTESYLQQQISIREKRWALANYKARTLLQVSRTHVRHMSDTDMPRTQINMCLAHYICPEFFLKIIFGLSWNTAQVGCGTQPDAGVDTMGLQTRAAMKFLKNVMFLKIGMK